MPGIQRQNEMTQGTGHYEKEQTAKLSSSSLSPPGLSSPHAVPMGLRHIWLTGNTSKGSPGLSLATELSTETMKPWPKSDSFRSQMNNAA